MKNGKPSNGLSDHEFIDNVEHGAEDRGFYFTERRN